jgi:hypothetical protein
VFNRDLEPRFSAGVRLYRTLEKLLSFHVDIKIMIKEIRYRIQQRTNDGCLKDKPGGMKGRRKIRLSIKLS